MTIVSSPFPTPPMKWGKINIPNQGPGSNHEEVLRRGLLNLIYNRFYQLGKVDELNQNIRPAADLSPDIGYWIVENNPKVSYDPQDTHGHYLLMSELHAELFESDNLSEALRQHYDRYFQSLEIDDLVDQTGLTQLGRSLLSESEVRIFSVPEHKDFICEGIGCYSTGFIDSPEGSVFLSSGQIDLLDTPAIGSSLAHELMRSAYYRYFNQGDIEWINQLVAEGFSKYPELKQWLLDDLGVKENTLKFYTEGYAYLSHYAKELPSELENNYSLFFKDRQIIVDIHRATLRNE